MLIFNGVQAGKGRCKKSKKKKKQKRITWAAVADNPVRKKGSQCDLEAEKT